MGRVGAAGSGTRSWERQGRGSQRSGPGLRAQPSAGRRVWGAPWLLPVVGGRGARGAQGWAERHLSRVTQVVLGWGVFQKEKLCFMEVR